MKQQKNSLRGSLLLLITATIWGVAFVAQSVGMDYVGPFTFNFVRNVIAVLVLSPLIGLLERRSPAPTHPDEKKKQKKQLLLGGVICGILLGIATNLQQFGIQYTGIGKAAFITTFYIVLVPVAGLFLKRKSTALLWLAVALSLVGLYLLCITERFSLTQADLILILCAVVFTFQILAVDHFSPLVSGVKLACLQFLISAVISGLLMLVFEQPRLTQIVAAWLPLLYAGALSSGVAYTLQILGQKDVSPTVASLIMSLESCISALAGWVILHQSLSSREMLGCVLMFTAIVLAQLPLPRRSPIPVES